MPLAATAALCLCLAAAAPAFTPWRSLRAARKSEYTFAHFEQEFERSYATESERLERQAIFARNLADVHAQNALHDAGRSGWRAGVNQFTDRLASEIPKGLVRGRRSGLASAPPQLPRREDGWEPPASIDWRDKNVVTPVKNQGGCGSCWAFSATETVESAVAMATGHLPVLAPQEMVDCVTNPDHCGGVGGCGGATQELGFAYAMLNGMAPETSYGYKAHDGPCMVGTAARGNNVSAVAGITGYVKLPANDNEALLAAVATVGPVAISVDAAWGAYESGVFDSCSNTTSTIDHGVQVVGYGEEDGMMYWIVRNSWGATWGDHGYIKLRRFAAGAPHCQDDPNASSGSGCDTSPKNITVCGECGMLSDSSYPTGGYVVKGRV